MVEFPQQFIKYHVSKLLGCVHRQTNGEPKNIIPQAPNGGKRHRKVAQLWQRPCELDDFKGVGQVAAKF